MNEQVPWLVRIVEEQFHRDTEDRPIREGRTPRELLRDGEIAYGQCPYAGSRHHHDKPMNVSALRQTSAHWDEIVDALGQLREGYAKARGGYGPDLRDVWYVSQLGCALPWFYILRDGVQPPPWAAALAKATLGTGILAQFLVVKMLGERWMPPPLTAETLVELAEKSGTLVGPSEVCAAPDKMIQRFCEALVGGFSSGNSCHLSDRLDEVIEFGEAYAAFKITVWLFYLARRFLYADAGFTGLLSEPVEPPDFFVVEPRDHRTIPPMQRRAWMQQLASFVAPLEGNTRYLDTANQIADALLIDGSIVSRWEALEAAFSSAASTLESAMQQSVTSIERSHLRRLFASREVLRLIHRY